MVVYAADSGVSSEIVSRHIVEIWDFLLHTKIIFLPVEMDRMDLTIGAGID
jgi:hypothetical protein